MSELMKPALYFVLGGLMVSLSTYLGTRGRGFLAAFVSTFPAITGATFVLIYLNAGSEPTLSYAKHLLWFVPPWLAYVLFIIVSLPRFGFWIAMAGGLAIYVVSVGLLKFLLR